MSTQAIKRPDNVPLGVVTIVLTVLAMSFTDAIVKYVSSDFPLWQIYVVRSLIVIPALMAMTLFGGQTAQMAPKSIGWVILRSLLLAFMYIGIYAAVPLLSLSVIAASVYTGPLFIALLSAIVIGERVGVRRWAAMSIGFVGVLVILRPATGEFSPLALIPVVAALFYAFAAVITRSKCSDETPMALALALNFSLITVGTIATACIVLWQPTPSESSAYPFLLGFWVTMGSREWGIISLLAALMVAVSIGLAKAYQSAPPAIIATFDYAYLVFAAFWSLVIFSEVPDAPTVIGMMMIAGAGFLVMQGREKAQSAPSVEANKSPLRIEIGNSA